MRADHLDVSLLGSGLPFWAPHAEASELDRFWRGVLEGSESRAERGLLTDAGFFEIAPLAQRFVRVWGDLMMDLILGGLVKKGTYGPVEEVEDLRHAVESVLEWGENGGAGTSKLVKRLSKAVNKGKGVETANLTRALHLTKLMNGLPDGYLDAADHLRRFLLSLLLVRCLGVVATGAGRQEENGDDGESCLDSNSDRHPDSSGNLRLQP